MLFPDQHTQFDPATYARNQQTHHAAVLQKVLSHSLSILPSLDPSSQSSTSSASSSSPQDTIFTSPVIGQNGFITSNPTMYSSPQNTLGLGVYSNVPLRDMQGHSKDVSGNACQYPYDVFGTYPPIPQNYNPINSINPGWLHNANHQPLPDTDSPEQYTSPVNTIPSRATTPPNPFDGTCHILNTDDVVPRRSTSPQKKRRRSSTAAHVAKETVYDVYDDDDEDDEDELVAVTEKDLLDPTMGKKDRRRTQNRLAQRAFRRRSKIHKMEAADHLRNLESQSKNQASQLTELTDLVDKLQRENSSLKNAKWESARETGAMGSYLCAVNMA